MVTIKTIMEMTEKDFQPGDIWQELDCVITPCYMHCLLVDDTKMFYWGNETPAPEPNYETLDPLHMFNKTNRTIKLIKRTITLKQFIGD